MFCLSPISDLSWEHCQTQTLHHRCFLCRASSNHPSAAYLLTVSTVIVGSTGSFVHSTTVKSCIYWKQRHSTTLPSKYYAHRLSYTYPCVAVLFFVSLIIASSTGPLLYLLLLCLLKNSPLMVRINSDTKSATTNIHDFNCAVWTPVKGHKWVCNLCWDNKPHNRRTALAHEKTLSHQDAIKYHSRKRQQHREDGSTVPEAQRSSPIVELRGFLDDLANTPDLELGNSTDNIGDYSVTKAMIMQGLSDFLDEDDLSDDQGAEMSEDEEIFTGRTWRDGMLL